MRNHDLEKLQAEISRHLPLLIFQKQQQQQQGTLPEQLQSNVGVAGLAGGHLTTSQLLLMISLCCLLRCGAALLRVLRR